MLRVFVCAWIAMISPQEESAFPGILWGTPLEKAGRFSRLERTSAEGRVERYRLPLERLGEAEVEECQLEFTDGRFSGIVLTTHGPEATHTLHVYLEGRFGKGSDDGHRFWQWLAGTTYVSLDEDSAGDGYLLWYGVQWQEGNK